MDDRKFLIAIQYYRAPTPLPAEWEEDLANIKKLGFEAVQLRIQWRWNERREGVYNFDDIDRLFDLAEKNNLDVIIKFMLETAPEYIYRKYNGYRISPSGEKIFPIAHGAFYVGGWLPCFDNPLVRERGGAFIREVAARYRNRKSLILYNAWNEPRSRPGTECACPHSVKSYRGWLRDEFKTVEKLNGMYGKAWFDFEDVYPPAGTEDYSEMYLWRHWAAFSVKERIKWVRDEIKGVDSGRPVMCHVGMCLPYQDVLNDTSDDVLNAGAVDIYGTSLPFDMYNTCETDEDYVRAVPAEEYKKNFCLINMIPDWIRGVRKHFYSYEIYSNNLHYSIPDLRPEDLRLNIYSQVAAGAKGICLWQYRAERFGNESLCSGLVNVDGSPTDRSREAGRILQRIKKERGVLENYEVAKSELAIVYDFRSDITSRLEDTNAENRGKETFTYLYKQSFRGAYRGFFMSGIIPDLVDWRLLKNAPDAHSHPFFYLAAPFVLNAKEAEFLGRYVEAGGVLITENCLGFRDENAWVRTASFPCGLDKVFGVRESIPRRLKRTLHFRETVFEAGGLTTCFEVDGAKVLGTWKDGKPAVTVNGYGKGKAVAIGFHPGTMGNAEVFLKKLCEEIGLRPETPGDEGLLVRKGMSGGKRVFFLFNYADYPQKAVLGGREIEVGARDVKEVIVEEAAEEKKRRRKTVSCAA